MLRDGMHEELEIEGMVRVSGGIVAVATKGSEIFTGERVEIRPFYMGKYPVTQKEFLKVVGKRIRVPPAGQYGSGVSHPMHLVSWYDALVYCNLRSVAEGLEPVYSVNGSSDVDSWGVIPSSSDEAWNAAIMSETAIGYRLPTEAEWEYAARGGAREGIVAAGWDCRYAGSDRLEGVGWYWQNSEGRSQPVGGKGPNSLGLFDMSGNVWEWCWSYYPGYPGNRRCRGGSWNSESGDCTVTARKYVYAYDRYGDAGFRVCRNFALPSTNPPSPLQGQSKRKTYTGISPR